MNSNPQWQSSIPTEPMSQVRRFWLTQNESTTKLLSNSYEPCQLDITLCHNAIALAYPDEACCLEQQSAPYWIREVLLYVDKCPWMWARSVFPANTLKRCNLDIQNLHTTPLGQIIFSQPEWRRSTFTYANININHKHYSYVIKKHTDTNHPSLWARRSQFSIDTSVFLLTEVLLPKLPRLPDTTEA